MMEEEWAMKFCAFSLMVICSVFSRDTIAATTPVGRETIEADGGKYRIQLDYSETPDLADWVHNKIAPMVQAWYPKLVVMLPSDEFKAPDTVSIVFDKDMKGVAWTRGNKISCSADWCRKNPNGEAPGSIIHELVHVVQHYGWISMWHTPLWLTEGIADYIRWFLYEPQSRGAAIDKNCVANIRYTDSYRVTANFLHWIVRTYDNELVAQLNAANRNGKYSENLWKEYTGRTVSELENEWKAELAK